MHGTSHHAMHTLLSQKCIIHIMRTLNRARPEGAVTDCYPDRIIIQEQKTPRGIVSSQLHVGYLNAHPNKV
jgi:hypothetical protein